jgi:threonyl-tRNA synthetase
VENAELFDMKYVAQDGKTKHPLLLHASIPGAIDRNLYAILERQAIRMKRGEKGQLPFWLAPTQVRLIPVSEEFIPHCEGIADALMARVDIDDRDEKVGRKIRDAEKEWVNMIIVFGDKEKESKTLPVRMRSGDIVEYTMEELKNEIENRISGFPMEGLILPRMLSQRPIFRG